MKNEAYELTNPDRILYPEQGITKRELADYYTRAARMILPYVQERPLTLIRCPQGRNKKCFVQRHRSDDMPEKVEGVEIREKSGEFHTYLYIRDVGGLVALVQMGALEIHPWGSRIRFIEKPEWMIFDLDPGHGTIWQGVLDAAFQIKEILEKLELTGFVKTSGGKGLHVYVPLTGKTNWETAKEFSLGIAKKMEESLPELYTTNLSKVKRRNKIFIDYLRNERGMTCVAPYSTRDKDGSPISVPLAWEELYSILRADEFTLQNIEARLQESNDPWKDFFSVKQSITRDRVKDLEKI